MADRVATLFGACIIAAAIVFVFRWEITTSLVNGGVTRLDRWTGEVTDCVMEDLAPGLPSRYVCDVEQGRRPN